MSGQLDKTKGKIKQATGDLTGNSTMRHEGKLDVLAGRAKAGIDRLRRKISSKR